MIVMVAFFLVGCSHFGQYLDFWKSERTKIKKFSMEPTADLFREIHPEDSFLLVGLLKQKTKYEGPILVVIVTDIFKKREIVANRIIQMPAIYYQAYLPEGFYDIYFFADIDGNGYFDENEMVGQSSGKSIHLIKSKVKDGLTFTGPDFTIDVSNPTISNIPIKVQVRQQDYIFSSLDDNFFDQIYGNMGMYDTKKFFSHTQRLIFALEKLDSEKTQILFVHGVSGTPRDFKYLVENLDRSRYQPLFYFYPSGMPLQKLGSFLADIIKVLSENEKFRLKKMIVVAHSMGGLVSLSALNELSLPGLPACLKGYISFNSPYGGVESAKKAVESAPAVLAAWRDVAPGSPFLEKLYQGSAPRKIPFHLFFGYETGSSSDGTIALQSQLAPEIQFNAHKIYGFNASHVGILNDDQARQTFYRILDDMDGRPPSSK
ncbi:MAG: hypothetical protein JXB25_09570 [Deltaproteobacteria bacterium]|nr:hypothetical protein [Deltaproteobacteria bacterium]